MNVIKKYKLELALFALALIVRCLYLGFSIEAWGGNMNGAVEGSDYYFVLSENILAGNGFSINTSPPYEVNSFRTPMMPYFLVAAHEIFGGYFGAILFQICIASLLPLLGMRLVRFIMPDRRIQVFVGIFLALEPYSILFSTIFYSETVFMFMFFIAVIYFLKYLEDRRLSNLLFSSAFMGFAMLTKPTIEFLPLFLGAILLWVWRSDLKRAIVHTALFCFGFVLIALPWVYRNYVVTGSPGLSPQTGVNLYTQLWPSMLSLQHGTSFAEEYKKLIASGVSGPNTATVKESAEDLKTVIPLLLQNPLPLVTVSAANSIGFFTHDGIYDVLRHLKIRPDQWLGGPALFVLIKHPLVFLGFVAHFIQTPFVLILIARLFWIVLTVLFVLGAVRFLMRERRPAGIVAIVIVTYFMLTTLIIGLSVNARYRLPVNVFIAAFAAYAALPGIAKLRSRYGV